MKGKRFFTLITFLFFYHEGTAQGTKAVDSTCYYIKKLNWGSSAISTNYGSFPYLLEDARMIIETKDRTKTKRLLGYMDDPRKTVVIHILLTKILEPKKETFSQLPHYNKDTIDNITYRYNNLTWI